MNALMLPTVSVVIPVYNGAATLERAVRSAMAQSLRHIEILIADDASTDTSAATAQALADEDPRIQYIRLPKHGGKSRAMNAMIERARGEWVAVLDADDQFEPHRLLDLISAAEACGSDLVSDNLAYFDAGAGRVLPTGFPLFTAPTILATQDVLDRHNAFVDLDCGLPKPVIRRSFIEAHDLRYCEHSRLAEDFYYLLNFFVAGGHCCLVRDPQHARTPSYGAQSRTWTTTRSTPAQEVRTS
jgi:succinoglycan biosynthesis protein ExoO